VPLPPKPPFIILREAQSTAREIIVDDVVWLVYELPPMPFDRRRSSSLVFESDNAVRRVRNFPDKWRVLSDKELFSLSWSD
jgi:hypothetical protein